MPPDTSPSGCLRQPDRHALFYDSRLFKHIIDLYSFALPSVENVTLIANWHGFSSLTDTDNERAAGSLHNLVGDDGQFVDLHDPFDLGEKPMQEAEVAAGDARD